MIFNNYAKYYNLLYKDKDYIREVDYIASLIDKYSTIKGKSLLDIGCGTGTHAYNLSQKGYDVTGIDSSEEMIGIAKNKINKSCKFQTADSTNFKLDKKFSIITSLFHVMSYQTTNYALEKTFTNVASHLENDGIFIFDFWYGPAVLHNMPEVRIKRLEDDELKIYRLAEPVISINDNIVEVNYELIIEEKKIKSVEAIKEKHLMRYFFKPEIEFFLAKSGLRAIKFEEWLTGNGIDEKTWGVSCIAKKVDEK
ncbi:MAG: class I SAM-dependent methyltransferase [Bacteroidota bacterium]|nr:class I SAM-dependent methyltransferase [Bacteroidota bacterium]